MQPDEFKLSSQSGFISESGSASVSCTSSIIWFQQKNIPQNHSFLSRNDCFCTEISKNLVHFWWFQCKNCDFRRRPTKSLFGLKVKKLLRNSDIWLLFLASSLRLRVGPVNEEDEQNIVQFEEPTPSTSQAWRTLLNTKWVQLQPEFSGENWKHWSMHYVKGYKAILVHLMHRKLLSRFKQNSC